jgi:Nucleotidyl transferase AbiEii toxin, Type IV TA system
MPEDVLAKLQQAGRKYLDDFMAFEVGPDADHPAIQNYGMQYDGLRFRAEGKLAGKLYGQPFGVDVAFGDPILGNPDVVVADDVHPLAEKLHAYTTPLARPNSRLKDLPDLSLLMTAQPIVVRHLRAPLEQTFLFRNTHVLPAFVSSPIEVWRKPYESMSREDWLRWARMGLSEGVG